MPATKRFNPYAAEVKLTELYFFVFDITYHREKRTRRIMLCRPIPYSHKDVQAELEEYYESYFDKPEIQFVTMHGWHDSNLTALDVGDIVRESIPFHIRP